MTDNQSPMAGMRVIDLSRILAGPTAAQMLGDFGAEVIKIERPGVGDESRIYGPNYLKDSGGHDTCESAMYVSANRNKKSMTLDIATPGGQEIVRKLASVSDVFIENYKVGTLKRYGLDYDSIRAINPRIVYCSITGFGQTGPYSHRPGYDNIFQAMGGWMSVTGHADGMPGGGPMKAGPSLVDVFAGVHACSAVMAALLHRERGGEGQFIDLAMLDCVLAGLTSYASNYLISGDAPIRRGNEGNGGVPACMLGCSDGDVMIVAGNDAQFAKLCEVMGFPALAADPRYATMKARVVHRVALMEIIQEAASHWKRDDLYQALERVGVPAGPINDIKEAFQDPQIRHRGLQVQVPHPAAGSIQLTGSPAQFSATPVRYSAPPTLGQHTREVLSDLLALQPHEIDALAARRVI